MRYISIDIETTGLNPETCQIIEFAAVADDLRIKAPLDSLPRFQTYVHHPVYTGEPYALGMHQKIFQKLAEPSENDKVTTPELLFKKFFDWLLTVDGPTSHRRCRYKANPVCDGNVFSMQIKINVAGKNFASFDKRFLDKLPNNLVKFNHRVIDPCMLYFNPDKDDVLPSTEECMRRAGLDGVVAHTALEDALVVCSLLRAKFKS